MKITNPAVFLRQVRQEVGRVAWPSPAETARMTAVVCVMSLLGGLLLFAIDQALTYAVNLALKI
ncbi:protein translocase subunit SecE [Alphaproteobacteria bacterium]|nr:protein translocase subunit SecE [Alphaproteobacteria bacterium]